MRRFDFAALVCALAVWFLPASAATQPFAVVCPATTASETPPRFTEPDCVRTDVTGIDPQDRLIWVKMDIPAPETHPHAAPLALHVSGKLSATFFLNGHRVGGNGVPGVDAVGEIPGLIDVMFHPPASVIRPGRNELVFLASAHRGFLSLERPLQWIAIAPATSGSTAMLLVRYVPSLATIGLVLLGALYFGVGAALGIDRARSLWLLSACGFVAIQLFAETYRGLVAYPYHVHDVRLVVIALCSAGFGLSVMGYSLVSLGVSRLTLPLIAVSAITFTVMTLVPGFDDKSLTAILVPLLASLIVAVAQARKGHRDAWLLATGFVVFISLLVAFAAIFIDVVLYLVVSAFLLFLFAQQGFSLARERTIRREAAARADRLQLALDQALEAQSDSELTVTTAGRTERIGTAHIVACRSDAGYSELLLDNGRSVLHGATLAELEATLPGNFLRVHRSYLINTRLVQSLARDPAGTGTLTMKDGRQIPVSRRTMPAVRQALK